MSIVDSDEMSVDKKQQKEPGTIDSLKVRQSGVEMNVRLRHQSNEHLQRSPTCNVFRNVNENSCQPTCSRGSACWRQEVAGFRGPPYVVGRAPVYWEGVR